MTGSRTLTQRSLTSATLISRLETHWTPESFTAAPVFTMYAVALALYTMAVPPALTHQERHVSPLRVTSAFATAVVAVEAATSSRPAELAWTTTFATLQEPPLSSSVLDKVDLVSTSVTFDYHIFYLTLISSQFAVDELMSDNTNAPISRKSEEKSRDFMA